MKNQKLEQKLQAMNSVGFAKEKLDSLENLPKEQSNTEDTLATIVIAL